MVIRRLKTEKHFRAWQTRAPKKERWLTEFVLLVRKRGKTTEGLMLVLECKGRLFLIFGEPSGSTRLKQ